MDDRTRATLDDLAELFLTSTTPARVPVAPCAEGPSESFRTVRLSPKVGRPGLVMTAAPDLAVPSPVVPAATLRRNRAPGGDGEDHAPVAVVTAAPVAPVESPPPPPPDVPPRVGAEAVFLGHLPTFRGGWLAQYAHHAAQQARGPVALVHVDDDWIDLELVRPGSPLPIDDDADPGAPGAPDAGDTEAGLDGQSLADALGELAYDTQAPAKQLLVCFTDPTSPKALARAQAMATWTVVCGADDAAVVAAYRLLKQLAGAHINGSTNGSARPPRRLRVMIVGSDEAESRRAALNLSAATSQFLGTTADLAGFRKRIVPVDVTQLGSYPDVPPDVPPEGSASRGRDGVRDPWPAVQRLLEEMAQPAEDMDAAVAEQDTGPGDEPLPPARVETVWEAPAPAPVTPAPDVGDVAAPARRAPAPVPTSPAPPAPVATPAPPPSAPAIAAAPVPLAPAPATVAAEPSEEAGALFAGLVADQAEPDLAQFLTATGELAGAVALQARSPRCPEAQLVLDQRGRLHVLLRHRGDVSALRAAVLELIETRLWVREHLALLQLTQRQCRFDDQAQPVLHVFTDQAKLAAALTSRFSAVLHVHLLQQVRLGDRATWVCNDLT